MKAQMLRRNRLPVSAYLHTRWPSYHCWRSIDHVRVQQWAQHQNGRKFTKRIFYSYISARKRKAKNRWGCWKYSISSGFIFGRDDRIRTCGLCVPNATLYQTEPHPVTQNILSHSSKFVYPVNFICPEFCQEGFDGSTNFIWYDVHHKGLNSSLNFIVAEKLTTPWPTLKILCGRHFICPRNSAHCLFAKGRRPISPYLF